jgi:hypothetical protein
LRLNLARAALSAARQVEDNERKALIREIDALRDFILSLPMDAETYGRFLRIDSYALNRSPSEER